MTNFVRSIRDTVMRNQRAVAIGGSEPMTFSELWSATDAFAGGLRRRDLSAGDAVGIHLSSPRTFAIAFYGVLRNGCVPVTIPSNFDDEDITAALTETNCTALVVDKRRIMGILADVDELRVAITVDSDGGLGIDWSAFLDNEGMNGSGSRTGIDVVGRGSTELGLIAYERRDERGPVGIAHTHSSLHAGASVGSSITFSGESRTHLGSLRPTDPTELAYGLNGTIRSGGQYLPVNRRDAETISTALESSDVDRTFVTPSQYGDLMSLGAVDEGVVPIRSPRATTGDSAESSTDANEDVVHLYALPETGITHGRTTAHRKSGLLGTTLPDVETRLLEFGGDGDESGLGGDAAMVGDTAGEPDGGVGEVAFAGPSTMSGYVERPELTERTVAVVDDRFWIRTGLTGCYRDGAIYVTGTEEIRSTPGVSG
ncbi:AMP-binding protein [Natrialba swarupiae]|uniref:Acyl--CoA ligase n=1 Tax=Natrialba swarupiae TaxID=2448032 RepID=A0A5D5AP49_9EURY|nr:AMP-binding protein [Natrialba swarupiae]TYT60901.1 acyl--CoA ligase [Natrialba swarupiae]